MAQVSAERALANGESMDRIEFDSFCGRPAFLFQPGFVRKRESKEIWRLWKFHLATWPRSFSSCWIAHCFPRHCRNFPDHSITLFQSQALWRFEPCIPIWHKSLFSVDRIRLSSCGNPFDAAVDSVPGTSRLCIYRCFVFNACVQR